MAESGATPIVHPYRRRALRAVGSLFKPLLPDDYLELIDPLWSTRELRGRIERVESVSEDAVNVLIRPGHRWPGHRPGQYLRIGVVVDGVHHWRAYSLTSEPGRPDGCIAITPKLVPSGVVSPYLVRGARPGDLVRLGGVEGTFVLPRPLPQRLLFITAGSGITPIMAMLRGLSRGNRVGDVVHLHSARREPDVIFGRELREIAARNPGLKLHLRMTGEEGRIAPAELDRICPDWRDRAAFACGPGEMLDELRDHWRADGDPALLSVERFEPIVGEAEVGGSGGRVPASGPASTFPMAAGWGSATPASAGCVPGRSGICAPARSTAPPRGRFGLASTRPRARSR
jgi:ferredoxin-NADP reductase